MIAQIESISKNFEKKRVLNEVTFSVKVNEIVGLIGPNGSGKTTMLNIMMGLIKPTSGTISYFEPSQISAAVSRKGFFDGMTVLDNLKIFASLKQLPISQVEQVLDLFAINFEKKKFGRLSAGMKQKVALTQAFMGNYKLMLLDEPTNHLDIDSILQLRSAIEKRRETGTSFLIASHVLTELERVCDRALFLFNGKIARIVSLKDFENDFLSLEKTYLTLSR